jgi:hypothetical protein
MRRSIAEQVQALSERMNVLEGKLNRICPHQDQTLTFQHETDMGCGTFAEEASLMYTCTVCNHRTYKAKEKWTAEETKIATQLGHKE